MATTRFFCPSPKDLLCPILTLALSQYQCPNLVLEPASLAGWVAADVADVLLGQQVAADANAVSMLPAETLLTLQA